MVHFRIFSNYICVNIVLKALDLHDGSRERSFVFIENDDLWRHVATGIWRRQSATEWEMHKCIE